MRKRLLRDYDTGRDGGKLPESFLRAEVAGYGL